MWFGAESFIFGATLLIIWVDASFEFYLMRRQLNAINDQTETPEELKEFMPQEIYEKTRNYAKDRLLLNIGKSLYYSIINSIFVILSWNAYLWKLSKNILFTIARTKSEIASSMIFMFLNNGSNTLIDLPILIFDTFVVEDKHGFNMQSTSIFLSDRIAYFIVSQFVYIPISAIAVFIIKYTGGRFYIYLWLFICSLSIVINSTAPIFEYSLQLVATKLPEGTLKRGFETIALAVNFPVEKIYIFKGSDYSRHTNAYFTGVFDSKRIVLYDTLLNRETSSNAPEVKDDNVDWSDDEILAIISHEFGHWKRHHLLIRLLFIQLNSLLSLVAFSYLKTAKPLLTAFGFYEDDPILIRLFTVLDFIMAPFNLLSGIILVLLSRMMEFHADDYAKSMGYAESLKTALIKLHIHNLTCPAYDKLYYLLHEAHPSLLERLGRLSQTAATGLLF